MHDQQQFTISELHEYFFRCVFISDPGNCYGMNERLGGDPLRQMHSKPGPTVQHNDYMGQ
jgi:hypothetical protein